MNTYKIRIRNSPFDITVHAERVTRSESSTFQFWVGDNIVGEASDHDVAAWYISETSEPHVLEKLLSEGLRNLKWLSPLDIKVSRFLDDAKAVGPVDYSEAAHLLEEAYRLSSELLTEIQKARLDLERVQPEFYDKDRITPVAAEHVMTTDGMEHFRVQWELWYNLSHAYIRLYDETERLYHIAAVHLPHTIQPNPHPQIILGTPHRLRRLHIEE